MKELSYYKKKLEDERKIVVNDLKGIGKVKDKRSPDDWQAVPNDLNNSEADSNEVADKIESYEENNDLVQKLEHQLKDIDDALAKIENNTYGICEISQEPIEEDRLEANPAARTSKKHMNDKRF